MSRLPAFLLEKQLKQEGLLKLLISQINGLDVDPVDLMTGGM